MVVDGLVVLLLGVGFVFAFLGLLVATLRILTCVVVRWERAHPGTPARKVEQALDVVAAAVAAAVRVRNGKES